MSGLLKAAIVGCGGIAGAHSAAIDDLDGAELVAVADIRPERAYELAARTGAHPYASMDEMLAAERIDVIHVCTPHYLHLPQIRAGLQYGAAVFSEKPPVISREQWKELEELASPKLGFCFQNRYNPEFIHLKKLLFSAEAGEILGGRGLVTWRREAPYYTESGWRGTLSSEGGGALINQSIHTLDLLLCVLGEPLSVRSSLQNHHLDGVIEVEDTVEAVLNYVNQRRALFYASTAYVDDAPVLLEVVCENVTVRAEGNSVTAIWKDGRVETSVFKPRTVSGKEYWGAGHRACIADFYDAVRSGRRFAVDVDAVRTTVDCMFKIYNARNS